MGNTSPNLSQEKAAPTEQIVEAGEAHKDEGLELIQRHEGGDGLGWPWSAWTWLPPPPHQPPGQGQPRCPPTAPPTEKNPAGTGRYHPFSSYNTTRGWGWRMGCRGRCWSQTDQFGGSSHVFLVPSAIILVQGQERGSLSRARAKQDQRKVGRFEKRLASYLLMLLHAQALRVRRGKAPMWTVGGDVTSELHQTRPPSHSLEGPKSRVSV